MLYFPLLCKVMMSWRVTKRRVPFWKRAWSAAACLAIGRSVVSMAVSTANCCTMLLSLSLSLSRASLQVHCTRNPLPVCCSLLPYAFVPFNGVDGTAAPPPFITTLLGTWLRGNEIFLYNLYSLNAQISFIFAARLKSSRWKFKESVTIAIIRKRALTKMHWDTFDFYLISELNEFFKSLKDWS